MTEHVHEQIHFQISKGKKKWKEGGKKQEEASLKQLFYKQLYYKFHCKKLIA